VVWKVSNDVAEEPAASFRLEDSAMPEKTFSSLRYSKIN